MRLLKSLIVALRQNSGQSYNEQLARLLRTRVRYTYCLAIAITVLSVTGCARFRQSRPARFAYQVDSSVQPSAATIEDGSGTSRPVAAFQDANGVVTSFLLHEVLVRPKNQADLQGFLVRYGATTIGNNAVPDPPPALGRTLDPRYKTPTEYLVRVDASSFDLRNFTADARKVGMAGAFKFSSDEAARLMALVTNETANGRIVSPNFVYESDSVLLRTQERPAGGGTFNDAFNTALFPRYGSGGSKANVTGAWQWVQAHGIVRRVRVAIIDGGFWLNATGNPFTVPGDGAVDFPSIIGRLKKQGYRGWLVVEAEQDPVIATSYAYAEKGYKTLRSLVEETLQEAI